MDDLHAALLRDTDPPLPAHDPAVELLIVDICRVKGWAPIRAQREMVKLEALGKWQRRSVKLPNKRRADAWRPAEVIAK